MSRDCLLLQVPDFNVPASFVTIDVTGSDVTADSVSVQTIDITNGGDCTLFACGVTSTNSAQIFYMAGIGNYV